MAARGKRSSRSVREEGTVIGEPAELPAGREKRQQEPDGSRHGGGAGGGSA